MFRIVLGSLLVIVTMLAVPSVEKALFYLPLVFALSVSLPNLDKLKTSSTTDVDVKGIEDKFKAAMNDDFNSPILIAELFEAVRYINLLTDKKETLTTADLEDFTHTLKGFVFDVLGLVDAAHENNQSDKLEGVIEMLIEMRNQARADKNWALSDEIRDKLLALGIQLKDGKEGTVFSLN